MKLKKLINCSEEYKTPTSVSQLIVTEYFLFKKLYGTSIFMNKWERFQQKKTKISSRFFFKLQPIAVFWSNMETPPIKKDQVNNFKGSSNTLLKNNNKKYYAI